VAKEGVEVLATQKPKVEIYYYVSDVSGISYPNNQLFKKAIFIGQKRRFHKSKTMFSSIKNIVLELLSKASSLPSFREGVEKGVSLSERESLAHRARRDY